jgi:2-dehydro-3-deoxyphosphogluconate aldolase/(4S)-4-hydroxy-2-oxoglutarate aldolase
VFAPQTPFQNHLLHGFLKTGLTFGADMVRVFPAKAMGSADYLRMVHEPLPQIPLTSTGGVTLQDLADYFKARAPFVGAGGDLVDKKAVNSGDTQAITERARQYMTAIRAARSQNLA